MGTEGCVERVARHQLLPGRGGEVEEAVGHAHSGGQICQHLPLEEPNQGQKMRDPSPAGPTVADTPFKLACSLYSSPPSGCLYWNSLPMLAEFLAC